MILRFQLQPTQILRHENQSYELEIQQRTKGGGVDVVVNCLPGIEHSTASLSCVSLSGFCIEVGTQNCNFSNSLGKIQHVIKIKTRRYMDTYQSDPRCEKYYN